MNEFKIYFIVTPGLEDLATQELHEKFPELRTRSITQEMGGFELSLTEEEIVSLVTLLKIPTRALLRMTTFKIRDLPKLFQKISKLFWRDYLFSLNLEFKGSAHTSRIMNTDKMSETIKSGILEYHRRQPLPAKVLENKEEQIIYFRIVNDEMTLSIDLVGEALYKRGEKEMVGAAPIRENLAAALLYALKSVSGEEIKALYNPMTGSGTFLLENQSFYLSQKREFALFKLPKWNKAPLMQLNEKTAIFEIAKGIEKDEKIFLQAKGNLLHSKAELLHGDFFLTNPNFKMDYVSIMNPPYGVRLKQDNLGAFYNKVIKQHFQDSECRLLGIIIPDAYVSKLEISEVTRKKIKFKNGGLAVTFVIIERG